MIFPPSISIYKYAFFSSFVISAFVCSFTHYLLPSVHPRRHETPTKLFYVKLINNLIVCCVCACVYICTKFISFVELSNALYSWKIITYRYCHSEYHRKTFQTWRHIIFIGLNLMHTNNFSMDLQRRLIFSVHCYPYFFFKKRKILSATFALLIFFYCFHYRDKSTE